MAKQSRLEQDALEIRKNTLIKNDYMKGEKGEYGAEHEDAKTHNDEIHPHVKGSGHGGHTHVVPNPNKSKTAIERSQIDTENGGGSYDKFGRNGMGGRIRLQSINIYGPDNQYGVESIDTNKNIEDGQYRIF